jgi:hypothetical protein
MRSKTYWIGLIVLALLASACAPVVQSERATPQATAPNVTEAPVSEPTTTLPETTSPLRDSGERPPAGAEREFSTDFSRHTVPYAEILSGGPPKDGIPAIDALQFVDVSAADAWLDPREPVAILTSESDAGVIAARAYPIQILMWHEIVNDVFDGKPVVVTYCPLCNTAIAFAAELDGVALDFGTTGRLRLSNLIMYDRQTESWWQQGTGEAIAGAYAGRRLRMVPVALIAWQDFRAAYPTGEVLSRETGYSRDYGRNPYTRYDALDSDPFLYDGPSPPPVLSPLARILALELDGETVAYPYPVLEERRAVNDVAGDTPVVILWQAGAASALDAGRIAEGRNVGSALAFSREVEGRGLTFQATGEQFTDAETGSTWNHLGQAVAGPLAGTQLAPLVGNNYFWFSWAAFKPETRVYEFSVE